MWRPGGKPDQRPFLRVTDQRTFAILERENDTRGSTGLPCGGPGSSKSRDAHEIASTDISVPSLSTHRPNLKGLTADANLIAQKK